jgi:hypothetical protein
VAMISLVKNTSVSYKRRAYFTANQMAFKEAVVEATKLSPEPVIATIAYSRIEYWYPNIKTCRLHLTAASKVHQSKIKQCGANYLLSGSRFTQHYLFKTLLAEGNSKYQLVFQNDVFSLWHIQN